MRLPKVELAMFRGLVMMMNADKVQSPVEILAIEKVVEVPSQSQNCSEINFR